MSQKIKNSDASSTSVNWEERYLNQDHPWDLQGVTPAIEFLLQRNFFQIPSLEIESNEAKKKTILIPGCGFGHDVIRLAAAGMNVWAIDLSARAIEELQQKLRGHDQLSVTSIVGDFFQTSFEAIAPFDYFFEYTFYCAIDPQWRPQYVQKVFSLLKKGGKLVAIFFPFPLDAEKISPDWQQGPPFEVTKNEIIQNFSPYFDIEFIDQFPSIEARIGKERLTILTKK